jgi:hypothetical protein
MGTGGTQIKLPTADTEEEACLPCRPLQGPLQSRRTCSWLRRLGGPVRLRLGERVERGAGFGGAVCVFARAILDSPEAALGTTRRRGRQSRQGQERTEPDRGYSALLKITEETGDGIRNGTMRHHQHGNQPHHDKPAATQPRGNSKKKVQAAQSHLLSAGLFFLPLPLGKREAGHQELPHRWGCRDQPQWRKGDGEDTVGGVLARYGAIV